MSDLITLVEDDQELAELTGEYLKTQGYRVEIVNNGLTAISSIVKNQPDLVILDLMLPGCDGLDVCRKIRPDFNNPILMLTARNDNIDEILGLEIGADDYLRKPVEPRLLSARVKALLRRSEPQKAQKAQLEDVIKIDDLVINNRAREVALNDIPLLLTTPEYELLWLLMSNAGTILSRNFIFNNLRGVGYDGINRVVDINVSKLRSKIRGSTTNAHKIKTIRNKGYLFVNQ